MCKNILCNIQSALARNIGNYYLPYLSIFCHVFCHPIPPTQRVTPRNTFFTINSENFATGAWIKMRAVTAWMEL